MTVIVLDLNSDAADATANTDHVPGDLEIIRGPGALLPVYAPTAKIEDDRSSIEAEDAEFVAACRGRLARQLEDES